MEITFVSVTIQRIQDVLTMTTENVTMNASISPYLVSKPAGLDTTSVTTPTRVLVKIDALETPILKMASTNGVEVAMHAHSMKRSVPHILDHQSILVPLHQFMMVLSLY